MEFPDLGCVPSKDKVKVGRDPTVNLNKKLSNAIAVNRNRDSLGIDQG
jgi:hypothetical protein